MLSTPKPELERYIDQVGLLELKDDEIESGSVYEPGFMLARYADLGDVCRELAGSWMMRPIEYMGVRFCFGLLFFGSSSLFGNG